MNLHALRVGWNIVAFFFLIACLVSNAPLQGQDTTHELELLSQASGKSESPEREGVFYPSYPSLTVDKSDVPKDPGPERTATPDRVKGGGILLESYFFPFRSNYRARFEILDAAQWGSHAPWNSRKFLKKEVSADGVIRAVFRCERYEGRKRMGSPRLETYLIYPNKIIHFSTEYLDSFEKGKGSLMHWRGRVRLRLPGGAGPVEWATPKQEGGPRAYRLKAFFGSCKTRKRSYQDCIVVEGRKKDDDSDFRFLHKEYFARGVGLVKSEAIRLDEKGNPMGAIPWADYELTN